MSLDLRIPLGLMFLIVGVMLSVYGLATRGSDIYLRSAGMNINLIWGIVMFVFGFAMFLLGRYTDNHPKGQPPVEGTSRPLGH
jgi:hypothetical protein